MYQSIALSVRAISSFEAQYSKWLQAVTLLSNEREIFVNTNFPEEVVSLISQFDNKQISDLFARTLFLVFNRIKKADLTELELGEKSKDKILVSNSVELRLQMKFNHSDSIVTICAPDNYVNPTIFDRVTNPRSLTDIGADEQIDPEIVLFPYLKLAKKIEIQDPYPPVFRTKSGDVNPLPIWKDMIQSCPDSKITFKTQSNDSRKQRKGGANYFYSDCEIQNALIVKDNTQINIVFSDEFFQGRPIKTDHFHISIEHGLGMFRKLTNGTYINNAGDGASIIITHIDKT